MTPRRRDLRLIPVALCAWAAAILVIHIESAALFVAGGAVLLSVGLLIAAFARPRYASFCGLAVVAIAAMCAVAVQLTMLTPNRDAARLAALEHETLSITGVITAEPRVAGVTTWVELSGRIEPATVGASVPIAVGLRAPPTKLVTGATVQTQGSASISDPGDQAVITVFADDVQVIREPPPLMAALHELRAAFVARSLDALPRPGAGLLPGLAIGDTSALSPEVEHAMQATSLTHLTAVSGANCAIVAGLVLAVLAGIGLPRLVRLGGTVVALILFVLLVTPEPSVVRAATMAVIALGALAIGRPGTGVAILSLAVTVLLLFDPWLAASYGFVLSVVATGALLLLAGPLSEGLGRWMPLPLGLALAVPLSAQLVCGPIILLLAPDLPVGGVLANLISMPAAPVATVVGMAACLLLWVPLLSDGLLFLAWLPSAWIAETAATLASFPGAQLPWPGGWLGFALHVALSTAIVALILPGSRSKLRRVIRTGSAGLVATVTGIGVGTALLQAPLLSATLPQQWSIAMCDVGQGDAVVVRSAGETALVDTGADPVLIRSCLARLGISRLDLVVITHFDLDHVGGMNGVPQPVPTIVHGPGEPQEVSALVADDMIEARAGMNGTLGAAIWEVVWPPAEARGFDEGNDTSAALVIGGGDVPQTVLLGDLSATPQALLARSHPALRAEVVKVSHHGSADQDPPLYDQLGAELALIGVGADNTYGHPTDAALAMLAQDGTSVGRTDNHGLILVGVAADTGSLWWWSERDEASR